MNNYIEKFIDIIKEEDIIKPANLSDKTIDKLNSFLPDYLIKILLNLFEIHEQLNKISFSTKYNIYNYIFSKEFYDAIKIKLNNNDNLKYIIYGGIICEIVKINMYNGVIDYLDTTFDNKSLDIKNALKNTILESIDISLSLIQLLYNDIDKKDQIYENIINLLKENNLFV